MFVARLDAAPREMVQDPHFEHGFQLLAPAPGRAVVTGVLAGWKSGPPRWKLAQWSSRHPLATNAAQATGEILVYSNAAKSVVLHRRAKTGEVELMLAVAGSVEYDGKARRANEAWVHLLAEQTFTNPPALVEVERLELVFEARLLYSRKVTTPDYNPSLHAAQFLMYFTVQNLNRQSSGYGKYLWFGVPIYDDRELHPKGHQAPDTGTGMFIYNPPAAAYTQGTLHEGGWVKFEADILPLMCEGLRAAWKRGFLTESTNFSDYRITGMNVGWEVPGIFDVSAVLRGLSLKAGLKAEPSRVGIRGGSSDSPH